MMSLRTRLEQLELLSEPRGPLLLSWRLDPNCLATTTHDGQRHTQRAEESRDGFFRRVAASVPGCACVWLDELDEKL